MLLTEIDRLHLEIAALRQERDRLQAMYDTVVDAFFRWVEGVDALKATIRIPRPCLVCPECYEMVALEANECPLCRGPVVPLKELT